MSEKKKIRHMFFLIIPLAIIILSGCGSQEDTKNDDQLTIWSTWMQPSSTVKDYEESPFHQGLSELTEIDLKWQFPTEGSDWGQAFNLMVSNKDLPDLIYYSWMGIADEYIDDGVIRDITDDLEEKAPNYWNFLKENPEFDRAMKTDDGRYYMFGFFREEPYQSSYQGPMVRSDWLDEQNLSIPQNIDEWDNLLQVFKEAYDAEFTFQTGWRMSPGLAGAFGAHGSFEPRYFIDESNNVQLAQTQKEWVDYISWLHDLYKDGLIDRDFSTIDDQGVRTKASQDKIGITVMNASTLSGMNLDAQMNGSSAQWVGIPYPNQSDGTKSASIFTEDLYNAQGIAISTSISEEKLDEAFRFLDWAYTEEGYNYWNFGKEGEAWELVDGEPLHTELITEHDLGKDEALRLYTGNWLSGQGIQASASVQQRLDELAVEASLLWSDEQDSAIASIFPAAVSMTAEERKEAANLENTINVYVTEHALKFVTGEESLDNFDEFVNDLNDQGLERLLEIRQAAYDRFLNR